MTWTYGPDYTTARDNIRDMIGDTDTTDQLVTDEQIAGFILREGSNYRAAAAAAEYLAAKAARQPDFSVGGKITQRSGQIAGEYARLAARLRKQANRSVMPYSGGISLADKEAVRNDEDREPPFFDREQDAEPGTEPVATPIPFPPFD